MTIVPLDTETDPPPPSGPPRERLSAVALRQRATFGIVALVLRMIVLQLTILGGDVYLRRLLQPADFGAFAIAQFALSFFSYFGDAGLGGALIQQKDEPTDVALSSIWSLQMVLSTAVVLVMWVGAPTIIRIWPDLAPDAVWLIRALSLALLLTSARAVPTMMMERHLQYGRLSVLEVLITLPFYAVAIGLAQRKLGVVALVAAVLAQGVSGVVGAFIMRPWRPALVIDWQVLRPIIKFGTAYQSKNIVGFLCGAITPVYAGRTLGQTQLGLIDWAQRTAYFPLKLVEVMSRVSFPLLSRMQGDREAFGRTLERSVQICTMGTLFFVGLAFGLGPNIVRVIYTDKWLPALPLFYVYALGISLGFLAPLVAPALDALGRPQVNTRFSIGWTTATLLLVPFTTPRWGSLGFAIGYCIPMVVGNLGIVWMLKSLIPNARLWPRVRASLIGGISVALTGHYVLSAWARGPFSFIASVLGMAALFLSLVFLLDRSALTEAVFMVRRKRPVSR